MVYKHDRLVHHKILNQIGWCKNMSIWNNMGKKKHFFCVIGGHLFLMPYVLWLTELRDSQIHLICVVWIKGISLLSFAVYRTEIGPYLTLQRMKNEQHLFVMLFQKLLHIMLYNALIKPKSIRLFVKSMHNSTKLLLWMLLKFYSWANVINMMFIIFGDEIILSEKLCSVRNRAIFW